MILDIFDELNQYGDSIRNLSIIHRPYSLRCLLSIRFSIMDKGIAFPNGSSVYTGVEQIARKEIDYHSYQEVEADIIVTAWKLGANTIIRKDLENDHKDTFQLMVDAMILRIAEQSSTTSCMKNKVCELLLDVPELRSYEGKPYSVYTFTPLPERRRSGFPPKQNLPLSYSPRREITWNLEEATYKGKEI